MQSLKFEVFLKAAYYLIIIYKLTIKVAVASSSRFLPFHVVVGSGTEGRALQSLPHLLATVAEVIDGPHVGELYHLSKHKPVVLEISTCSKRYWLYFRYFLETFSCQFYILCILLGWELIFVLIII